MAFDDIARTAAVTIFKQLGVVGTLIHAAVSTPVKVVVHKDSQAFPAGEDSFVTEARTEISFLTAEAPTVVEGDQVVIGATTYTVKTRVFSDGLVHRWEVR